MKKSTKPSKRKSVPAVESIDPTLPTPVIVNLAIVQFLAWYLTIPVAPPQQPPAPPIPLPPDMAGLSGLSRAQMKNAVIAWINVNCPAGNATVYV